MHLQQTKARSRRSGGPQYYFHDVPESVKDFLRKKGACQVVLQTRYGIAASPFVAVGRDHKLSAGGQPVPGAVGHDRIQGGSTSESIGSAIRRWYGLPTPEDFERIDVDVSTHKDGHFILTPLSAKLRTRKRSIELERPVLPLSFNNRHQSSLWHDQFRHLQKQQTDFDWIRGQLRRVVDDHCKGAVAGIHESDLLRTAGALSRLGVHLGPYLVKSYDCDPSYFHFLDLPCYPCPVEVKKNSKGFKYQILKYKPLPRATVLCVKHDLIGVPEHIDVIELACMSDYLSQL